MYMSRELCIWATDLRIWVTSRNMYISHEPPCMRHVMKYVHESRTMYMSHEPPCMYKSCHEISIWVKKIVWLKKYVCESKNMYMGPELRIRPTFRTNTYHELFYEYKSRHKMCIWVTKYVFKPRTMSIRAQNLTQHLRVIWLVYMYDMIYSYV
jgi:hypothetical protein